jgi:multiple sugar transport system substrate-binding protein
MAIVGPWAIAVYGDKVKWGAVPVPTSAGMSAEETHTFSDAKNVAIYSACKAKGTAWDVLKFATSKDQDGSLLDKTGQMPLRSDLETAFPAYFQAHPEYKEFASFASRTVEVPNVDNSIEIWQKFRDAYSSSVIFAKTSVDDGLSTAASEVDKLAGQS